MSLETESETTSVGLEIPILLDPPNYVQPVLINGFDKFILVSRA